jgi:hypothetical protein
MRRVLRLAAALAALVLPAIARAADAPDVPGYHATPDRAGHYVVPGLTWARAASVHLLRDFAGIVEGQVNAQPLYWRPAGAAHGLVIVATEDNAVHALDAGSGREVWRRVLGPPVPRTSLPCGNIDPMGITGTPVLDAAAGALYLDAMTPQADGAHHLVYALSLRDGAVLPGWPVDVAAGLAARDMHFEASVQGQRGALALVDGRLYVPFGGHWGDCGAYRGWVVGLETTRPGVFGAWVTTARKGGIWTPAGIAHDGRFLYAATGNTIAAQEWGGGEAIIRLPPDLQWRAGPESFFAPPDWRELDARDADLGGSSALPIDLPDGGAWLLALGKDGKAYLLDRTALGGVHEAPVTLRAGAGSLITAPAAYALGGAVMVAFQGRPVACPGDPANPGLGALRIQPGRPPRMETAWCAAFDGRGEPIVTTADASAEPIVWAVGAEGDGRLHGWRGDTGARVAEPAERLAGLRHFATPIAAEGRLFVAGDDRLYAFGFGPD